MHRGLRRRLQAAWLVVAVERVMAAFWPAGLLIALFLAFAFSDALPSLPPWLHSSLVLMFGLGLVFLLARGATRFQLPARGTAQARIEARSGFVHRPVAAIDDRLPMGGGDPAREQLWRAHRAAALAQVDRARVPVPDPDIAAQDRYGLRIIPFLLLGLSLIAAGPDAGARLERAVSLSWTTVPAGMQAQLWITPPDYTGMQPLFTTSGQNPEAALAVPQGSRLQLRILGARGGHANIQWNGAPLATKGDDQETQQVQFTLAQSGALTVRAGGRLLSDWAIEMILDRPPEIVFSDLPGSQGAWFLAVPYQAEDDYGLASITLDVQPVTPVAGVVRESLPEIRLAVPTVSGSAVDQAPALDLASHPLAGTRVQLTLEASDALSQVSRSDTVEAVLPERRFTNPTAGLIVQARKSLIQRPSDRAAPVDILSAVLAREAAFDTGTSAYLAVTTARAILAKGNVSEDFSTLLDMLWSAAVRLEDGNRAVAERNLQQAEQELREALQSDADAQEIARLVDQLQQAMRSYLDSLAQDALDVPPTLLENMPMQSMVNPQDMVSMLDQLRRLSEAGANDAAQQMLSDLTQMLEQMRNMQSATSQQNQSLQALDGLMDRITELADQQSDLLDETFQASRTQDLNPARDAEQAETSQAEQSDLRQQLGGIMSELGELTGQIPGGLGEADTAMRQAERALGRGDFETASEAQARALDALQQGMRQAAQNALQSLARQGTGGLLRMPGMSGQTTDPLGRRTSPMTDQPFTLPTERSLQQSREILEELRRRGSDRTRSQEEQDYIRRLLRRF